MKRITRFLPAIALIATVAGMLAFRPASESNKLVPCTGTLFVFTGNTAPESNDKYEPENYVEEEFPASIACSGAGKVCAICVGPDLIGPDGLPIIVNDGTGGEPLDDAIRTAIATGVPQSGGSGSSAYTVYPKS